MSASSRAAVWEQLRPSARKLQQESLDRDHAAQALRELKLPPRRQRIPDAWQDEGWLKPHLVAVLDLPRAHAQQIAITRIDHRNLQRLRRRGPLVDFTEVQTRFHATLLVSAALQVMDVQRVQLDRTWALTGHSQAWVPTGRQTTQPRAEVGHVEGESVIQALGDIPGSDVNLASLAVTNGLR